MFEYEFEYEQRFVAAYRQFNLSAFSRRWMKLYDDFISEVNTYNGYIENYNMTIDDYMIILAIDVDMTEIELVPEIIYVGSLSFWGGANAIRPYISLFPSKLSKKEWMEELDDLISELDYIMEQIE